jgi:outer membrane receptor protein involved in Fe transport
MNQIKDNLVQADVNPSSSFSRYGNLAQIENKGLEIDVNFAILRNSDLKWNMSGTFGTNRNKITRLEGTTSILLTGFAGTSSRAVKSTIRCTLGWSF